MARRKKKDDPGGCATIIGIMLIIGLLMALKKIIGVMLIIGALGAGIYGFIERDRFKQLQIGQQIGAIALILFCLVFGIYLVGPIGTSDIATPPAENQQETLQEETQHGEAEQSFNAAQVTPASSTNIAEESEGELVNEEKPVINLTKATVIRTIDGDTIEVELEDGTEAKIRMIGVDTPESTIQHEPYGEEASNFTKERLEGKEIYLEKDVSDTDKYGRLLRYVWLEPPKKISEDEIRTKMFNAILLLEGYAQVATYPPDVKYVNYFTTFQEEARNADKGLWAIDSSSTTTLVSDEDSSIESDSSSAQEDRIVYWTPKGKSYHYTKNCPTLSRSKTILSGQLSECPKSDPCDRCTY